MSKVMSYKNRHSKNGSFSCHIDDEELCIMLEVYSKCTNTNKKYIVTKALKQYLENKFACLENNEV